jgi:hypothetical protein
LLLSQQRPQFLLKRRSVTRYAMAMSHEKERVRFWSSPNTSPEAEIPTTDGLLCKADREMLEVKMKHKKLGLENMRRFPMVPTNMRVDPRKALIASGRRSVRLEELRPATLPGTVAGTLVDHC